MSDYLESMPPEKLTLKDEDGDRLAFSLVPSSWSEEEGAIDATPSQFADGG